MFTCCIIHNVLHAIDGLDEMEAGDEGWDGAARIPGSRDDFMSEVTAESGSGVGVEVEPGFAAFRSELVDHFVFRGKRRMLRWVR